MSVQTIWVSDHVIVSTGVHAHDYYQLMYCSRGTGEIEINGIRYPAVAGNAYLAFPMESHALIQKDRLHLVEIKFTVHSETLAEGLRRLAPEFSVDDYLPLRLSFAEIKREGLSHALYSHDATNAALHLFLLRLIRQTYSQKVTSNETCQSCYFSPESSSEDDQSELSFLKIIDYIEEHLADPITLDELAQVVFLDKSYLITRFKKIWGVPPMQYINFLRIERAKVLLATTEKSATEIAHEVGFQSIHYFSRYFKEKEGITPIEYRAECKSIRTVATE